MNREELRSAYGKIILSEEYKQNAKEKLRAAAKERNGSPARIEHYADEPDAGADITIRLSAEDKKPRGNIFMVMGVSAAAIAVLVLSAVLINTRANHVVSPVSDTESSEDSARETEISSESSVTEETDTPDTSDAEYFSYPGIGELKAERGAMFDGVSTPPEKTEDYSEGLFGENGIKALPDGFEVNEEESGVYGDIMALVCEGRGGRFSISACDYMQFDFPFVDGMMVSPTSMMYNSASCRLISAKDYYGANSLNAEPVEIRLNYTEMKGVTYFGGQWTDNGTTFVLQTENLNFGEDIQDIFAYAFYGLDEMPARFGEYENSFSTKSFDTPLGNVTFNELAVFDNGDAMPMTEKSADGMSDHFINPIDADKLPCGLKPEKKLCSPVRNSTYFESTSICFKGDNGAEMTYTEAEGDTSLLSRRYGISAYTQRANLTDGAFSGADDTLYLATNSAGDVQYAEWRAGDRCCYLTCENMGINDFTEILYGLAVPQTGDIAYFMSTSAGEIRFQPLKAVTAPDSADFPEELKRVDASMSRTADLTRDYGLYEITLKSITDSVIPGYYINYPESVCMVDSNDNTVFAALKYENDAGGELYINFDPLEELPKNMYYVTNEHGEVYEPLNTNDSSSILSYTDRYANNYIDPKRVSMRIGGTIENGVKYFYAYFPMDADYSMNVLLSAKGCETDEFAELVKFIMRDNVNTTGKNRIIDTIDTEHGALVINAGEYLGTGGARITDVYNGNAERNGIENQYTNEDVLRFTGNNAAFVDPPLPFEPYKTDLSYCANYSDVDMESIRGGETPAGEEDNEKYLEAKKYYVDGRFRSDKTAYFEDKTPTMREFSIGFYETDSVQDNYVDVIVLEGDFGERYHGMGFVSLTPEPSTELCEEYMKEHADEVESGRLTPIYAAAVDLSSRDPVQTTDETLVYYYAGFKKDGLYYSISSKGVSPENFAKILKAIYEG